MTNPIFDFYSRKDVRKLITKSAIDREVGVVYGDKGFGKRPDILEYDNDVFSLAQSNATSFHISEEHWTNPLLLSSSITEEEKEKIRCGWDLILDLDGVDFEYAKILGKIIMDYLEGELNMKNVSVSRIRNKE